MNSKKTKLPKLSDAEWIIMKPFWENGPMAARELFAAVGEENDWSYTTVKTMLARLVKKGALEYKQVGNSYLYSAKFTRDEVVGVAVRSFSDLVLDGALKPFLLNFFDGRSPNSDELDEIRELIDTFDNTSSGKREGDKI